MADAIEDPNTHDVMDNIDEDNAAIITVLSKGNVQLLQYNRVALQLFTASSCWR